MGDLLYKQVNKKLLAKKQVKGQCLSVKTSISRICLLSKVKNAGIQVKGTFPFLLEHLQLFQQKIIQFIQRKQVYFSSSNVSTDTTAIVKD